jgi:predicted nucleotidyltransferase
MTIAMTNSTNTAENILKVLHEKSEIIHQRFGVKTIGLFGSWVRKQASPASDIDLLVEFDQPSFDKYMDLKFYLEDLLEKPVDLVLKTALKPRLQRLILDEVRYAA